MEPDKRLPGRPRQPDPTVARIPLTQEAIAQAFPGFLRRFYANRYAVDPDSFQTQLDQVASGGLIADGILRFRKREGEVFTCAYEVTPADRVGEVRYGLNVVAFLWDCAAFGAVAAAVVYAVCFITRHAWLLQLQIVGNLGVILGVWLTAALVWYFFMRNWRKYRYIYAVEQFRRYFADDQWVVLAEDVFPSPVDPYMVELRNQCTYNGFGLAIMDRDAKVRVVVAPSRLDFYGKDRKMVEWLTQHQWYQAVTQNMRVAAGMGPKLPTPSEVWINRIVRPAQYLFIDPVMRYLRDAAHQPLSDSTVVMDRFMKAHSLPKWLSFLAFLVMGLLGRQLALYEAERDHMTYRDVRELYGGQNPEDYPYTITGEPIPYKGGIIKQYPERDGQFYPPLPEDRYSSGKIREAPAMDPLPPPTVPAPQPVPAEVAAREAYPVTLPPPVRPAPPADAAVPDPCAAWSGSGYLVLDSRHAQRTGAEARVLALRSIGFPASIAPLYCLEAGGSGYQVYLSKKVPRADLARDMMDQLGRALSKAALDPVEGVPSVFQIQ